MTGRPFRFWVPGLLGALAVVAVAAGGFALMVTGVIDVRTEARADREACEVADVAMRDFGSSMGAVNPVSQPSAARQMVDDVGGEFVAAAELAGSEEVREDLEFSAGYFADVSESLRSGNAGVFWRLSGEAESAADRVRAVCRPSLSGAS